MTRRTVWLQLTIQLIFVAAWGRPELTFPTKIEYSKKNKIYFADIVMGRNISGDLVLVLEKQILFENKDGIYPEMQLSSLELSRIIKKSIETNETLQQLNPIFKIPPVVKFTPTPNGKIATDELQAHLNLRLASQCESCNFSLLLQNKVEPSNGDWQIDYSNTHIKPTLLLPVVGNDYKSFRWLSVKVHIKDQIPVALTDLNFGKVLDSKDYKIEEREIYSLSDRFQNTKSLSSLKLTQSVKAGDPIFPKITKREPLVKKNELVRGFFGNESFEVQNQFLSEEDGYMGELIRIRSLDSGKKISARVLDKDLVRIQE